MRSNAAHGWASGRRLVPLLLLVSVALVWPAGEADAQLRTNRLRPDTCLTGEFSAFDDVIMTALASHQAGRGDVYQAICDEEDCWGFSINRGASVNVLTTGLTPGEYTWYVCAWNGVVRRVVANLAGGAALFLPAGARGPDTESRSVSLTDPDLPEDLRRFVARLRGVTR